MTILDPTAQSTPVAGRASRSGTQTARLELRVQPSRDHAVVRLWGELHADTVGDLVGTAATLAKQGCHRIVLDLSRVYDLDANSVAQLGRLRNLLAAHGGGLWLAAPRPWVRRSLDRMCRPGTFDVQSTVGDATAQLKRANAAQRLGQGG